MSILFLFLLATSWGSLSTLFWIPEDDLGRGYFQMNALIVLGLLGLAVSAMVLNPFQPFGEHPGVGTAALGAALAGSFFYYAAIWRERWIAARVAAAGTLLATTAALGLAAMAAAPMVADLPYRAVLLQLALWSSGLLLGWSLITMLLGHWYLVAPRLNFRHLTVYCWVLLAAVVLRTVAVGAGLAAGAATDPAWRLLTSFTGQGMFLWFRLLWGLAMPLTLAWMSLHCARQRSNQSATGILYVVVVGCFIGELTAYYLIVTTGIPV